MFGRREKLCAGPPQAAADVGGELEVSAMIVEGALQIDKATTEKKNAKTFCYFGTHSALEIFFRIMRETSSKMISSISISYDLSKQVCIVFALLLGCVGA